MHAFMIVKPPIFGHAVDELGPIASRAIVRGCTPNNAATNALRPSRAVSMMVEQKRIVAALESELTLGAASETDDRKRLHPNGLAEWEIRVGTIAEVGTKPIRFPAFERLIPTKFHQDFYIPEVARSVGTAAEVLKKRSE